MEPIDIGTVAGSVTAFYIALSAILKKIGYISLQNPKKNGNGNGNGNKYDPKYCRDMHKVIDLKIQAVEIETGGHKEQLKEFKTIRHDIGSIRESMATLAAQAKNRMAGDQ